MNITRTLALLAGVALIATSQSASAATVKRTSFGKLSTGQEIDAFTLTNSRGVSARVITWGATLQSLVAPDRT